MSRLVRILRFRPVATTLVLAALVALYEIWLGASVGAKLPTALPAKGDFEIVLGFPPEAFHVTRLQDIGRVIRVDGRSVFVRDMAAPDVQRFARNYWVRRVDPWQGT